MRPNLAAADPGLPRRRRQPITAVFDIFFFAENCIKMKDIGLKGGARPPPPAPLHQPLPKDINEWKREFRHLIGMKLSTNN